LEDETMERLTQIVHELSATERTLRSLLTWLGSENSPQQGKFMGKRSESSISGRNFFPRKQLFSDMT
jgi:hypothetical protein